MTSWNVDTVVAAVPVCPNCGHAKRILVRSVDQGDSRLQLAVCSACSRRYRILWEVPAYGNQEVLEPYRDHMEDES